MNGVRTDSLDTSTLTSRQSLAKFPASVASERVRPNLCQVVKNSLLRWEGRRYPLAAPVARPTARLSVSVTAFKIPMKRRVTLATVTS
jgi:hypothetical protein